LHCFPVVILFLFFDSIHCLQGLRPCTDPSSAPLRSKTQVSSFLAVSNLSAQPVRLRVHTSADRSCRKVGGIRSIHWRRNFSHIGVVAHFSCDTQVMRHVWRLRCFDLAPIPPPPTAVSHPDKHIFETHPTTSFLWFFFIPFVDNRNEEPSALVVPAERLYQRRFNSRAVSRY